MSVLEESYNKIISEIEKRISNPEDLKFIKEKILELSLTFVNTVNDLSNITNKKINQIEKKQKDIEEKMSKVETTINNIESDIYTEEGNFDFEIVCPYCDFEFIEEIDGKTEIPCPNCNNIIELDWNEEIECSGYCSNCHGCEEDFKEEEEQQDNEDDM